LRPAIFLFRILAVATAAFVFALSPVLAQQATTGQTSDTGTSSTPPPEIRPVRTDSPRDTLRTFLRLRDSLETALLDYRAERSTQGAEHISLLLAQFRALVDLSQVAKSSRSEI